jgi:hypothetical protein
MTQKKLTALTGSGQTHPEASKKDNFTANAARISVISNIGGKNSQFVNSLFGRPRFHHLDQSPHYPIRIC